LNRSSLTNETVSNRSPAGPVRIMNIVS
jgi:hypothetical protein